MGVMAKKEYSTISRTPELDTPPDVFLCHTPVLSRPGSNSNKRILYNF